MSSNCVLVILFIKGKDIVQTKKVERTECHDDTSGLCVLERYVPGIF